MAGPCACIYLPVDLDATLNKKVRSIMSDVSTRVEGDDFWVNSTLSINGSYSGDARPFFVTLNDASNELELGDDATLFENVLGWRPRLALGLAAMCNQQQDHQILGELCCFVSRDLGGRISMHGDFNLACRNRAARKAFYDHPDLVTVDFGDSREHLFSPDALSVWMAHPEFRMIK